MNSEVMSLWTGLWNEQEAAEFLSISLSTLRRDRSNGKLRIPLIRIGATVRYRAADLSDWIASNTVNKVQVSNTVADTPIVADAAQKRGPGRPRKGSW